MAVGGIDSATDRGTGRELRAPDRGTRLSSRTRSTGSRTLADGGAYSARDTHGRIRPRPGGWPRSFERSHAREPGREVDLVAHSQGGVVVDAFLQHEYDAADPTFPPLGTVVTLSSPHQGAPLATAAEQISSQRVRARRARRSRRARGSGRRRRRSPTSGRGRGRSARLWRRRLPDQVDFTTIGAVDDVVVPASRTGVPGATAGRWWTPRACSTTARSSTTPRPWPPSDSRSRAGRPPCPGVATAVRGAVEPLVITRLEHAAGAAGRAAGMVVDAAAGILP